MNRLFAFNRVAFFLIIWLVLISYTISNSAQKSSRKPMKFFAEVYVEFLDDPALEMAIDKYGITELDIHIANRIVNEFAPLSDFPLLNHKVGTAALVRF